MKLRLDELSVESFEVTADDGAAAGTVFARGDGADAEVKVTPMYPCTLGGDTCPEITCTCQYSCLPSSCPTCSETACWACPVSQGCPPPPPPPPGEVIWV